MANILSYLTRLPVPSVDVKTVHDERASGKPIVILDVRTDGEHASAHIPGSISLPFDRVAQEVESIIPDKNTVFYLHCNVGIRSSHATKMLLDKGYANARNIIGGLYAWKEAGYPVEEGREDVI